MTWRSFGSLMMALALAGGLTGRASAQALVADHQAVFLAPVDGSPINSPRLFAGAGGPLAQAAPETPDWGTVKADLDFLCLQPIFPGRAVRLQVPGPGVPWWVAPAI